MSTMCEHSICFVATLCELCLCVSSMCEDSMCEHSLCDSTVSVRITKSTPEKSTSVLGPDVAEHQKYENYHEK